MSIQRLTTCLVSVVFLLTSCEAIADEAWKRVWKDKTASFRVEATLLEVSSSTVSLERADNGQVIRVPISRLCDDDVAFLRTTFPLTFAEPSVAITTAAELAKLAQVRRYAVDALAMYDGFLANIAVAETEKEEARKARETWVPLANARKIRCGVKWYTQAEFEDVEKDERQLLEVAESALESNDSLGVNQALEDASQLNPSSIRANFRLGILSALHPKGLSAQNAHKQFTECVRRLQGYSSDWTDFDRTNLIACYNNLALASIRQRNPAEALRHWEKCAELGTPGREVLHNWKHLQSIGRTNVGGRQGGADGVYLATADKSRLDRLLAAHPASTQAYQSDSGWRYSRLATESTPIGGTDADQPPMLDDSLVVVGTGTGFVVGANHVVTNRHVVESASAIKLRFEEQDESEAIRAQVVSISADENVDLALVKSSSILPVKGLPINPSPLRIASELRVLGFPQGNLLGKNLKVSRGVISSLPPLRGIAGVAENSMIHDAVTSPGSSGGPICDEYGAIIGVHYAASAFAREYKFAVTASDTLMFLDSLVPDVIREVPAGSKKLTWEEAVEQVRKATVQIVIYADSDNFDPVAKDLGEITWDAYADPWCMACYGRSRIDCPVRGCAKGGVRDYVVRVIPNGTGNGGRVQRTPVRVACDHCDGKGKVDCSYCEHGFDSRFSNNVSRAWRSRYADYLRSIESN